MLQKELKVYRRLHKSSKTAPESESGADSESEWEWEADSKSIAIPWMHASGQFECGGHSHHYMVLQRLGDNLEALLEIGVITRQNFGKVGLIYALSGVILPVVILSFKH